MSETTEKYICNFEPGQQSSSATARRPPAALPDYPRLIARKNSELDRLREYILYLVERVPVDADPKLVEITRYIRPFALTAAEAASFGK